MIRADCSLSGNLAQHGYLPAETRDYVPKVYATIKIARNSKQYGFQFDPQHYTPKHETVPVPGGVKLAWLEKQTGVSESSLRTCNPELCQAATPPGASPYDLCVPIGTKESVRTALATCPLPPPEENPAPKPLLAKNEEKPVAKSPLAKNMVETRSIAAPAPGSHTVKPGDTWFSLARKYQCSVDALASFNALKPSAQSLKTGQTLKVPPKGQVLLATAKKDTAEKPSKAIAIPAKASRPAQKSCVSYPVRSGDTLWSIADRFRVPVEDLSAHNKLRQGQKLVAGNTLTVCNADGQPAQRTAKKKN